MGDYVTYDLESGKPHPYHILEPSPWPLLSSFAGGLLAVGLIFWFHGVEVFGVDLSWKHTIPGLMAVIACMFFWWRDVIIETKVEKVHNETTEVSMKLGMGLFICSEFMFFVAFFWAFFDASLMVGQTITPTKLEATGGVWPPVGVEVFNAFDLPFLMTMILLLSGCTATWAHAALLKDKNDETVQALWLTVGLAFIFLGFQVYEYYKTSFGFGDHIYSSVFFMATGFHGFHVFVGMIFLAVCAFRAMKKHFTPKEHFGFEAAAWYWHFVDVVWLFLFVAIYFWGNMIGMNQG